MVVHRPEHHPVSTEKWPDVLDPEEEFWMCSVRGRSLRAVLIHRPFTPVRETRVDTDVDVD